MTDLEKRFAALGVHVPEILLPSSGIDYAAWAVVACDQYSSEREYWEGAASRVGNKPSALRLIFPECYLEDRDKESRIRAIQSAMVEYLAKGVLKPLGKGFILVERRTPYEKEPRLGIVLALDLENYVFGAASKSLIRPTEGTIVERLPPRMAIRRGAPLELPHIMVLVDDPARSVIEPLYARRSFLSKLYDFTLMAGAGSVKAWKVEDAPSLERLCLALEALLEKSRQGSPEAPLLFAVGDGNHSLATAKAVWEELKASLKGDPREAELLENHPARFALVELLNIYDPGLPFHPIHRVLFNVDQRAFFSDLEKAGAKIGIKPDAASAFQECESFAQGKDHIFAFVGPGRFGTIRFENPQATMAAGTIQEFLDSWLKFHPEIQIDYIHGSGSLAALGSRSGNLGLYLPPVEKGSFFATVIRNGAMPRKTFSMGEAPEKRFYIEARKIVL
ncbi:MAG: hypothetical protein FD137_931 [Spirochaetes bacterium]|nr:MAG: hypothetical protein FD137_931 [Spirochaetota bacterium]